MVLRREIEDAARAGVGALVRSLEVARECISSDASMISPVTVESVLMEYLESLRCWNASNDQFPLQARMSGCVKRT